MSGSSETRMADPPDELSSLHAALVEASARLETTHVSSEPEQRAALIDALNGIALAAHGRKDLTYLSHWFGVLALALRDTNYGVLPPILKPIPKPDGEKEGRPSDPLARWLARAQVALAVQVLVQTGMTKPQAAESIARSHPQLDRLVSRKGLQSGIKSASQEWHKLFQTGRVMADIPLQVYRETQAAVSTIRESDAGAAVARALLDKATELVGGV